MSPVEVWYVLTDDVTEGALRAVCDAVLARDERARGLAFRFETHRREHLVTRALARGVLARRLGVDPASLAFRRNGYGRPELHPANALRFNLTNTTGLVACAVAEGREVGVDAEPFSRAKDILEVAPSVFTVTEMQALETLEGDARLARAVELWTAKEAYIKARGLGFSLPPKAFEVGVQGARAPLRFLEGVDDDPARWGIELYAVEGHSIAVCAERSGSAETEIVLRRADLGDLLDPGPVRRGARASARGLVSSPQTD